jgi:hypothetical protein
VPGTPTTIMSQSLEGVQKDQRQWQLNTDTFLKELHRKPSVEGVRVMV